MFSIEIQKVISKLQILRNLNRELEFVFTNEMMHLLEGSRCLINHFQVMLTINVAEILALCFFLFCLDDHFLLGGSSF